MVSFAKLIVAIFRIFLSPIQDLPVGQKVRDTCPTDKEDRKKTFLQEPETKPNKSYSKKHSYLNEQQ